MFVCVILPLFMPDSKATKLPITPSRPSIVPVLSKISTLIFPEFCMTSFIADVVIEDAVISIEFCNVPLLTTLITP